MENILQIVKQFLEFRMKDWGIKKKNQMIKLTCDEKEWNTGVYTIFALLLVPILFIRSRASVSSSLSLLRQWFIHQNFIFSSIPANPNVYRKISVFLDPQLKKDKGRNSSQHTVYNRNNPCNDEGKAVFKIADRG